MRGENDAPGGTMTRNPTERSRVEERHVCAFCRATFDASERFSCPECSAEIVLRGER